MIPTFLARLINGPVIGALRRSLKGSEQDAVAYIAQLHQNGPGLYTAATKATAGAPRRRPAALRLWSAQPDDGYVRHGVPGG